MTNPASHRGLHASHRVVLAVAGADARSILQDVITNDLGGLETGQIVYAALLTPQGKYLFDFFVLPGDGDQLLIDVARDRAADLAQRLSMYCLRRDARIEGVAPLHVFLIWGDGPPVAWPDGAQALGDPRDPGLGWRVYAPDGAVMSLPEIELAERSQYDAMRISLAVPETGIELVPEDTYILEAGFERLNGVDFRKGCYVGQEVTARMKHKTELRKGLATVRVHGIGEPGTPIVAAGKPAGTLFSVSGDRGLAHLRFDRAGAGMSAGDATVDYEP